MPGTILGARNIAASKAFFPIIHNINILHKLLKLYTKALNYRYKG